MEQHEQRLYHAGKMIWQPIEQLRETMAAKAHGCTKTMFEEAKLDQIIAEQLYEDGRSLGSGLGGEVKSGIHHSDHLDYSISQRGPNTTTSQYFPHQHYFHSSHQPTTVHQREHVWANARHAIQQYLHSQRVPKKLVTQAKTSILLTVCKREREGVFKVDTQAEPCHSELEPRARFLTATYLSLSSPIVAVADHACHGYGISEDNPLYGDWRVEEPETSHCDTLSAVSWPAISSQASDTSSVTGDDAAESSVLDCSVGSGYHTGTGLLQQPKSPRSTTACSSPSRHALNSRCKSLLAMSRPSSMSDTFSGSSSHSRLSSIHSSQSQKVVLHWHFTSRNGSQSFSSLMRTSKSNEELALDISSQASFCSDAVKLDSHATVKVVSHAAPSWHVQATRLPFLIFQTVVESLKQAKLLAH